MPERRGTGATAASCSSRSLGAARCRVRRGRGPPPTRLLRDIVFEGHSHHRLWSAKSLGTVPPRLVIEPIHDDSNQQAQRGGGAKYVNSLHPGDAKAGLPPAAGLKSPQDVLPGALGPVRVIEHDGQGSDARPTLDGLVLRARLMEQLVASLGGGVHLLGDVDEYLQLPADAVADGARVDLPVEVNDCDHDAHHKDIGEAPLPEPRQPVERPRPRLGPPSHPKVEVQKDELDVRPRPAEQHQEDGAQPRPEGRRHPLGLPQPPYGESIREGLDVAVVIVLELIPPREAERLDGPARDGLGGVRPDVDVREEAEAPHGSELPVHEEGVGEEDEERDEESSGAGGGGGQGEGVPVETATVAVVNFVLRSALPCFVVVVVVVVPVLSSGSPPPRPRRIFDFDAQALRSRFGPFPVRVVVDAVVISAVVTVVIVFALLRRYGLLPRALGRLLSQEPLPNDGCVRGRFLRRRRFLLFPLLLRRRRSRLRCPRHRSARPRYPGESNSTRREGSSPSIPRRRSRRRSGPTVGLSPS
mmetsp:Transcript_47704/g.144246  ORF Transcript_47704/g.144246 Transcript_47704/m.144246 type:complete len:529 (+) Transcript_47704:980-2566(+)